MTNDIKRLDPGDILFRGDATAIKPAMRQTATPALSARKPSPAPKTLAGHCAGQETRVGASTASIPRAHLFAVRSMSPPGKRSAFPAETDSPESELRDFTVPLGRIMNQYRAGSPLHKIAEECERLLLKGTPSYPGTRGERTDFCEARARHADRLAVLFQECAKVQDESPAGRELLRIIEKMYDNRAIAAATPAMRRLKSGRH